MAYSQKYTIVQFIESAQERQIFSMNDWPLHITLADVFAINLNQSVLDQLADYLASKKRFSALAKAVGTLGGNENPIEVTHIENSVELQSLHNRLIELLEANGAIFNSPQFLHDGFMPHSSHHKQTRLAIGRGVTVDRLSLIDMFADGNWQQRRVINSFALDL